jgi:hypothetical protein
MPVDFRLSSFPMLNITLGCRILSVLYGTTVRAFVWASSWFTARGASQDYNTTPLHHSLFSNTIHQRIGVTVLVAVKKIPRAVNAALNPFIDVRPASSLSPLFLYHRDRDVPPQGHHF